MYYVGKEIKKNIYRLSFKFLSIYKINENLFNTLF